jgi:hypothetical protein
MKYSKYIVAQLLAATALGKIKTTGIWTGHDWEDTEVGIKIVNGEPKGLNDVAQKRIDAPKPIDGDMGDYK